MIEEATVDAYGESEQVVGFYTMLDEHLAVPFETTLLGMPVTIRGVDVTGRDEIVAICRRQRRPVPSGSRRTAAGPAEPDGLPGWPSAQPVALAAGQERRARRTRLSLTGDIAPAVISRTASP
jgi:hypothetical protein